MTTLEDLARVLGGTVRERKGQRYLDTTIGGLAALVIRRSSPLSNTATYDLGVASPDSLELDPIYQYAGETPWFLDLPNAVLPHLRHGYVFAGCRGGVLFASSLGPQSLEHVVTTLWDLAGWARLPWCSSAWGDEPEHWATERERERRERRQRMLERDGFVAGTVLVAALVRRFR